MRRLISLHDSIERQLAEVVTELADRADRADWRALGYNGMSDYTRRGLGWSESTFYGRVQLVRRLRRLPIVRQAYQQGHMGLIAAQTITRLLARENAGGVIPLRIPDEVQQAWVDRAAGATIKRLRDETRAVARIMVAGIAVPGPKIEGGTDEMAPSPPDETRDQARASQNPRDRPGFHVDTARGWHDVPKPLDDTAWHASLYRQVGTARRRVQALAAVAMATPGPLRTLRLTLPRETALALRQALAAASRNPRLVETFAASGGAVPEWAALLILLQEFVETWDVDQAGRRPSAQRIYVRDGWRCMAPGCTSRRNLEVHHVVYRSRGGKDRPENLVCLCRFHHQMGEHGLLAEVRGDAPLGLAWRMGKGGLGGDFRNELRLTG